MLVAWLKCWEKLWKHYNSMLEVFVETRTIIRRRLRTMLYGRPLSFKARSVDQIVYLLKLVGFVAFSKGSGNEIPLLLPNNTLLHWRGRSRTKKKQSGFGICLFEAAARREIGAANFRNDCAKILTMWSARKWLHDMPVYFNSNSDKTSSLVRVFLRLYVTNYFLIFLR